MIVGFILFILKVLFLIFWLFFPYAIIVFIERDGNPDAVIPLDMKVFAAIATLFFLWLAVELFIPTMF